MHNLMSNDDFSRGRCNAISQEMHKKVSQCKTQTYATIMMLIDGNRCTLEIAELIDKPLHKISGRFSELKHSGSIIQTARKNYKGSSYSVYLVSENNYIDNQ